MVAAAASRAPEMSRAQPDQRPVAVDWDCAHCGAFNFARRTACFQCFSEDDAGKLRRETGRDASSGAAFGQATRVVFLKNIPFDVTEEEIANKVATVLDKSQIRSIQIPTEKTTGQRKGFAFVDCSSIENATLVKDALNGATLRDDWSHGALSVNYSFSARSQKQSTVNSTATNAILQATAASSMTKSAGARDSITSTTRRRGIIDTKRPVFCTMQTPVYSLTQRQSRGTRGTRKRRSTPSWARTAKSERDAERSAAAERDAAETKDKRPVVATVSSAPTTTTTTKPPATTDVDDVHAVSLTIPQYRDRAKERRKLHGEKRRWITRRRRRRRRAERRERRPGQSHGVEKFVRREKNRDSNASIVHQSSHLVHSSTPPSAVESRRRSAVVMRIILARASPAQPPARRACNLAHSHRSRVPARPPPSFPSDGFVRIHSRDGCRSIIGTDQIV